MPNMHEIIAAKPCDNHKAGQGDPCWEVWLNSEPGRRTAAICGDRVKSAGWTPPVETPTKPHGYKRKGAHK